MAVDSAFAPYRLAPGALAEDAARAAEDVAAEPLLARAAEPLPRALANRALADVATGHASSREEACRAADGSSAGGDDLGRACLASPRHRARIASEAAAAVAAGFAGVCLDRPDAPLALGLLGAGFCPECQRELALHLSREYGEHFQPLDYVGLVRAAVAQASGALSFSQLPFGRDFWRVRHDALPQAVGEHARAARDAARLAGRPFEVVAQFEAVGGAQLRAARHLDGAIFPARVARGATGLGLARMLRGAMGRRSCALAPGPDDSGAMLARTAALAATCGIELSGIDAASEAGRDIAAVRRLVRRLRANGLSAPAAEPVTECALLYSAEADLWTDGRHREAVERAAEALAAAGVQAPVVPRVQDAPPGAVLVLAGAEALSPLEANAARRRLETGGALLSFGEPGSVDELGRPAQAFLPSGKAGGTRVKEGLLATVPAPVRAGRRAPPDAALLEKALAALLGKGPRAARVAHAVPVQVTLYRAAGALVAHLVASDEARVHGATLFLGVHVAGGARRARFVSVDGEDVRLAMSPSGSAVSAALPPFRRYAVVSIAA